MKYALLIMIALSFFWFKPVRAMESEAKSRAEYTIRWGTLDDRDDLKLLYKKVASIPGGLARSPDEVTDEYINEMVVNGLKSGIIFLAEYEGRLIGSIIKYKLEQKIFSHFLQGGSILVDPDFQRQGIGTALIVALQEEIKNNRPEIYRVHLLARESNPAIHLYQRLGFIQEGRLKGTTQGVTGTLEDDIYFAWFNPNFDLEGRRALP